MSARDKLKPDPGKPLPYLCTGCGVDFPHAAALREHNRTTFCARVPARREGKTVHEIPLKGAADGIGIVWDEASTLPQHLVLGVDKASGPDSTKIVGLSPGMDAVKAAQKLKDLDEKYWQRLNSGIFSADPGQPISTKVDQRTVECPNCRYKVPIPVRLDADLMEINCPRCNDTFMAPRALSNLMARMRRMEEDFHVRLDRLGKALHDANQEIAVLKKRAPSLDPTRLRLMPDKIDYTKVFSAEEDGLEQDYRGWPIPKDKIIF